MKQKVSRRPGEHVLVVHWDPARAAELVGLLASEGYAAEILGSEAPEALRSLRDNPPQAVVIDLSKLPSHGRAIGVALRQQKATRLVPIVFVGGAEEKVAATRVLLPDAIYSNPENLAEALTEALKSPLVKVVVPDTMQGYSGTPLAKKLGIKEGTRVLLLGAPEGFEIPNLPPGVDLRRDQAFEAAVILIFIRSREEMDFRCREADGLLPPGGRIWFVWPKKTAGGGQLTQQAVREFGLGREYVDYKVCAVDATWSGLCFARRGKT